MKKKFLLKIIILVTALTLAFVGIVLYSENFHNLDMIESMKKIFKQDEVVDSDSNTTIVDVTGIKIGKETEHEHIYKTMYDESKHWEECKSCGEKRNEKTHSYTTTWKLESESCDRNNSYTKTCLCGYSETGHKPCVWNGSAYVTRSQFHERVCTICKGVIENTYYLNSYGNGKLYNVVDNVKYPLDDYPYTEICYLPNGTKIDCMENSTCSACKGKSTANSHFLEIKKETGVISCSICKRNFGVCSDKITINNSTTPPVYTIVSSFKLTNNLYLAYKEQSRLGSTSSSSNLQRVSQTLTSFSDWQEFTVTTELQLKNTIKEPFRLWLYINQQTNGVYGATSDELIIYPDKTNPTISKISVGDTDSWSKSRSIVITGTENYCDTINVKILDDTGKVIYTGGGNVDWAKYTSSRQYGDYSISCTPELEAGYAGRKFKVIVTDSCENSVEQEFTISKIDGIAPEPISSNIISGEWTKERNFTFIATDKGIGNVQIAFNNVNDYKLATRNDETYSRNYTFIGDIYSQTNANVYYKDEVGNVITQKVIIDKIDNTAPTILNGSIHNNELLINANDVKEGLGEGSGIIKYRFVASETKIENSDINNLSYTEINKDEKLIIDNIDKMRYVYVVAEDLARKYK